MDELTNKALEKLELYKKYLTGPEYRTLKEKILSGELALETKGGGRLDE